MGYRLAQVSLDGLHSIWSKVLELWEEWWIGWYIGVFTGYYKLLCIPYFTFMAIVPFGTLPSFIINHSSPGPPNRCLE